MFVLFGGGDAGGWYIGRDGKIHRIPPWNPDIRDDLSVAETLVSAAARVVDKAVKVQIETAAAALVQLHAGTMQKQIEKMTH